MNQTHGTLLEENPLTVSGFPASEERIVANGIAYLFRAVLAGNRLYSVSVTGSPQDVDSAEAKVFVDSFEILR